MITIELKEKYPGIQIQNDKTFGDKSYLRSEQYEA